MSIFYRKETDKDIVNVGDKLEITIENYTDKGHGIALHKGFAIMIPGVKKGERLNVVVTKLMKNYALAKKLEKETLETEVKKETQDLKKPLKNRKSKKVNYEEKNEDEDTAADDDNLGYVAGEDSTNVSDDEDSRH